MPQKHALDVLHKDVGRCLESVECAYVKNVFRSEGFLHSRCSFWERVYAGSLSLTPAPPAEVEAAVQQAVEKASIRPSPSPAPSSPAPAPAERSAGPTPAADAQMLTTAVDAAVDEAAAGLKLQARELAARLQQASTGRKHKGKKGG